MIVDDYVYIYIYIFFFLLYSISAHLFPSPSFKLPNFHPLAPSEGQWRPSSYDPRSWYLRRGLHSCGPERVSVSDSAMGFFEDISVIMWWNSYQIFLFPKTCVILFRVTKKSWYCWWRKSQTTTWDGAEKKTRKIMVDKLYQPKLDFQ